MTDTSPQLTEASPLARRTRTPGWLDRRLVFGVVLVLVSVLVGASILSAADRRQARWALTRDLAAGTVLTSADVRPARVQLGAADSRYVATGVTVVGRSLDHPMKAGELLPLAVLDAPAEGVEVSVPLRPENGPVIVQGDRIAVWLSTKTCQGTVLLSGVPVQSVTKTSGAAFGSDTGSVLVVRVSAVDAKRVVSALDLDGAVIRVGVLSGDQPADPVAPDLGACAGGTK